MPAAKTFTCINCPLGCSVTVAPGGDSLSTAGNECSRGAEYALQEYRDPRRILTGTVKVSGGLLPRLPVKTDPAIARAAVAGAARALDKITVRAPVRCGDVIREDFFGSRLVATRDLPVEQVQS